MRTKASRRIATGECHDAEVRPYIEQLMNGTSNNSQTSDGHSNELSSYVGSEADPDDDSGNPKERKVRGPSTLKYIWLMPPGKTIAVEFNRRNQPFGKEGRKLASFLGFVAWTPELTPLNIEDWRLFDKEEKKRLVEFVRKKFTIPARGESFVKKSLGKKWRDYKCDLKSVYLPKYKTKDAILKNRPNRIPRDQWTGLVSYWLSDKAKKRTQANRNNRSKQKMPHTTGSKSFATLMNERIVDGIEPTRVKVFILTHTNRKDGRLLDEESTNITDKMKEKLVDGETCDGQPPKSVAW